MKWEGENHFIIKEYQISTESRKTRRIAHLSLLKKEVQFKKEEDHQ